MITVVVSYVVTCRRNFIEDATALQKNEPEVLPIGCHLLLGPVGDHLLPLELLLFVVPVENVSSDY